MGNFAATDVTYTVKNLRRMGNSKVQNRVQLAFGDSSLTYSTGGVPLTKAKLGCPNTIESLHVVATTSSLYSFMYIDSTEKLLMLRSASNTAATHQHNFTITKGAILMSSELGLSADAATATVNNNAIAATQTLTTNTPIVASGTLAIAADAFAEPNTVAIASQTIQVEVIGW